MAVTEPIRNKHQIRELANFYLQRGQIRNYCLIILGVHTALRISDLLRLRWEDVYDFKYHRIRNSVAVTEQKTGKTKIVTLNKKAVQALSLYATQVSVPRGFLMVNIRTKKAISRIQAYRIIRSAAEALHLQGRVSCHSLRKSFGYHAWKAGVSPAVIMEIFNHSSLAVTRRYLGVSQDDKDEVYLLLNFSS
ncbi:MAG: tyrosine-type recombinase/integrase [Syntrophomonadaceae bacterium]|jgi:integrase|nr:tyrosine-type recombinase/integrase [Syntrophomonadaceae bacterium]